MSESPLDILARFGYGARGAVYILLGLLCLASGLSGIGEEQSASGALSYLKDLPFGEALLAIFAAGLLLFVLWRLSQSVFNADERGPELGNWIVRIAQLVSALTYSGLAFYAARLAANWAEKGGSSNHESLASKMMQQPFGPVFVGGAALILFGVGIAQIYRGMARKYLDHMEPPTEHRIFITAIASLGLVVRGILFMIAAGFLFYAALTVDPSQAGSISDALDWIRKLPFGAVLYLVAALGLVAFGVYGVLEGIYRHVDVDGPEKSDFHFSFKLF